MRLTLILSSIFVACSIHAQTIKELQSEIVQLQKQVTTLQANKALAIAPFVTVDVNSENGVRGPNIVFTGANIHIVSGSGATNDNAVPTGLGNLIIGYDEVPTSLVATPYTYYAPNALLPNDRQGSHNLVVGRFHRFLTLSFGGVVSGELNTITAGAELVGGGGNLITGFNASILGGFQNTAAGPNTSVVGGELNQALGQISVVLGGVKGINSSPFGSLLGGYGVILDAGTAYALQP